LAAVRSDQPLITLTTDFGINDNYVGIIKGIILHLNPKARIIDISHSVPPFDIGAGRYLLETSYRDFPSGTIHLAIIDPGVGTKRKAILLETPEFFFIGPDNGLLSFLPGKQIRRVFSVSSEKYFLREISSTFHGRDIFAPVAAYLSMGVSPAEFGPEMRSINRPRYRRYEKVGGRWTGRIIYIDRFGNLVTSFKGEDLPDRAFHIYIGDRDIGGLRRTFGSVRHGNAVGYINSFGYLEIAVNRGSAAELFGFDRRKPPKILIAPVHGGY
jgi:S-adenosylmethionine hydrolase